jgi:Domain of unknown function (DUF1833)
LLIVDLSHGSLEGGPLRFVNNTKDVISNGETYVAYPFAMTLPDDAGDRLPRVGITIDNVDRQIVDTIRILSPQLPPPKLGMSLILASDPDVIEAGPFDFTVRDTSWDAFSVTGVLAYEDVLNRQFPAGTYNARDFVGLAA